MSLFIVVESSRRGRQNFFFIFVVLIPELFAKRSTGSAFGLASLGTSYIYLFFQRCNFTAFSRLCPFQKVTTPLQVSRKLPYKTHFFENKTFSSKCQLKVQRKRAFSNRPFAHACQKNDQLATFATEDPIVYKR